jgi:hypothetical protein
MNKTTGGMRNSLYIDFICIRNIKENSKRTISNAVT